MHRSLTCTLLCCVTPIWDGAQKVGSTGTPSSSPTIIMVDASPNQGFMFPYLLRLPGNRAAGVPKFLIVEPNNTGHVSKRFEDHLVAAKDLAQKAVGADLSKRLNAVLLVPVFPRSEDLYTHSLNRRTLQIKDERLRRIDLQLLRMAEDARRRLAAMGIAVHEKLLLTGFSASGAFVNRFTALHPDKVQAVAAGAVNGMLILPTTAIGSERLPFPIGISDMQAVTGQSFKLEAWRRIPQFIYMGADDTNDAVKFDDAYTTEERALIYRLLGERMQPERWERCQSLYRQANANVVFKTYPGIGHGTNGKIHADIAEFFHGAIASAGGDP
jgi:dienelactone hydrolase